MTHAWGAPGPHAFVPAAVREARRWVSWAFELPHTVEIYDGPDLGPGFDAPQAQRLHFVRKRLAAKTDANPHHPGFQTVLFFWCALYSSAQLAHKRG